MTQQPKTFTLVELKSMAYDCVNQINALNHQLTQLNNEIARLTKEQYETFTKQQVLKNTENKQENESESKA